MNFQPYHGSGRQVAIAGCRTIVRGTGSPPRRCSVRPLPAARRLRWPRVLVRFGRWLRGWSRRWRTWRRLLEAHGSRADTRHVPPLVSLELSLTRDRGGDRAAVVAKFDDHESQRRIQPQSRVGNRRRVGDMVLPRQRRDRSGPCFSHGITRGAHRGDWLDDDVIWHGGIDRKRCAVLALGTSQCCSCTG